MSAPCDDLYLYLDGELEPAAEESFRAHLPTCERCQRQLHEAVQLEMRTDRVLRAPVPVPLRPPRRLPRPAVWAAGAMALAASALLVFWISRPARPDAALWLAQAPTRTLEARLSYPAADRYRPYDVPRSGGPTATSVPLESVATLERQGDLRGIAAAYLVRGDRQQAAAYLAKVTEASPEIDSDRAVIALGQGNYAEALTLLERALSAKPNHAQALWNRALVLRSMGLPMMAAQAFQRMAALGEPGWSREAQEQAARLEQEVRAREASWTDTSKAGRDMISGGPLLTPRQVLAHPGLARIYLYHSLRASPSRERAEALLPLAEQLDAADPGRSLSAYVRRVAARDFTRRKPLAEAFGKLVLGTMPPAEVGPFLERLRRSQEQDILLGALLLAPGFTEHLKEFHALAVAAQDPWYALLAEERVARAELDRGEAPAAEARVLRALRGCADPAAPNYRCENLERLLADVYSELHRLQEARQHAQEALRRSLAGGDWSEEVMLLEELGQLAVYGRSPVEELPLAHAYLEEVLARSGRCDIQEFVRPLLAVAHEKAFDFDGMRRELDAIASCDQPPSLARAAVLADLARLRPKSGDGEALHQGLAALRASGTLSPGQAALADEVEGRFELEQDRAKGQALLRQAIAAAERLPDTEVTARKARQYGYTSLLFDAAKHGEYAAALGLFAAEPGVPEPARCVLAATAEDERTLVVARGADGALRGHYDVSRRTPLGSLEGLVPEDVLAMLRPCKTVEVMARPPLQGRPGLLPADMAWSYRVGQAAAVAPGPAGPRLVVSNVTVPEELLRQNLPELPRLSPPEGADVLFLQGYAATPSRVLQAMGRASEIEINTHGQIDIDVSDASYLVLAKDADGRFVLTARDVLRQRLEGRPVVLLAACYAGQTTPYQHDSFGLTVAFVRAGARVVLAATQQIPSNDAAPFFEPVLARIRAGEDPAVALRDERVAWLKRGGAGWVRDVLLFM